MTCSSWTTANGGQIGCVGDSKTMMTTFMFYSANAPCNETSHALYCLQP